MGRNLDDVINSLPAERQARIARAAARKVADMLAHATTLAEFRKAVGETQAEVATELGIGQNAVSQREWRSPARRHLCFHAAPLSEVARDEVGEQAVPYPADQTASAAAPGLRAPRRKPGAV